MASKKNWTIKAAVLMFALVLITSCLTGGTFAKYVTGAEGTGTARVAKFGVTITADDSTMFKTTYETDDTAANAAGITNSVESSNSDRLVAPGTSENGTAAFSVKGTPEVAVNVAVSLDADSLKEVFLKKGTYADYTGAGESFTLDEDYYPVKFTLTKNGEAVVTDGKLADVNAKLAEVSKDYAPNTDLSQQLGEYSLSWKWDFNGNDQADTMLGDLAAGTATADSTAYSTDIAFTLNATVTQID